jgi:hypothetical protein
MMQQRIVAGLLATGLTMENPSHRVRAQHYISINGSPFVDSYGGSPEGKRGLSNPAKGGPARVCHFDAGTYPERFNEVKALRNRHQSQKA